MKLRAKLLLIVVIPLFLVYAAYISLDFSRGRTAAVETVRTALGEQVGRHAALLDVFFAKMASETNIAATLLAENAPETLNEMAAIQRAILNGNPDVSSTMLAYAPNALGLGHDFFGARVLRTNWGDSSTLVTREALNSDYLAEDWFVTPLQTFRGSWTEPYYMDDFSARLMCTYSAPIIINGTAQGVLALDAGVEHITQLLHTLTIPGGYSVLVSRSGAILSHPDPELIVPQSLDRLAEERGLPELADFARLLKTTETDGVLFLNRLVDVENVFVAYARVPGTGWFLLGVVEEAVVMAPVLDRLYDSVLQLAGSALLVFLFIYLLAARQISIPLASIAAGARRVAKGDLDTPVIIPAQKDEISELAVAFNTMQTSLKSHISARVQDATARRMAEGENKAKSDFISNMSHELRTPLNAISGMAYLALNTELTEKQAKYVRQIQDSSKQMLTLIDDIFTFTSVESGSVAVVNAVFDPRQELEDIIAPYKKAAVEKHLVFNLSVAETIPQLLMGDTNLIRQALDKLLDNAVKFTHEGAIFLECVLWEPSPPETGPEHALMAYKRPPCPPPGAADGSAENNEPALTVRFLVKDTGIGIAAEQREKVFMAFSQADTSSTRRYGGMGLGLSLARHLADLMNGSLTLLSTPGRGTTMELALPMWKAPLHAAVQARRQPQQRPASLAVSSQAAGSGTAQARPSRYLLNSSANKNMSLLRADCEYGLSLEALQNLEALLAANDDRAVDAFSELADSLKAVMPALYVSLRLSMNKLDYSQAVKLLNDAIIRIKTL